MSPFEHLREAEHQLDALVSFPIGSRERDTCYQLVVRDMLLVLVAQQEQIAYLTSRLHEVESEKAA